MYQNDHPLEVVWEAVLKELIAYEQIITKGRFSVISGIFNLRISVLKHVRKKSIFMTFEFIVDYNGKPIIYSSKSIFQFLKKHLSFCDFSTHKL